MKILIKNLMAQTETKPSKPVKTNVLITQKPLLAIAVTIMLILSLFVGLFALGPSFQKMVDNAINTYKYNNNGWTIKTESKTYPVSHIRIDKETEYYDENQLKAGYSLLNYNALKDKGDTIALNIIKTKALEGDDNHYRYNFTIDGIDYGSIYETSDSELLFDKGMNVFSEVEYKKGLKEPEVKVYYKLKYHYGKLKKKEMKYETTLVLPD